MYLLVLFLLMTLINNTLSLFEFILYLLFNSLKIIYSIFNFISAILTFLS